MPANDQPSRTRHLLLASPALLALLSSIALLLLPIGQQMEATVEYPGGTTTRSSHHVTLLQDQGWSVLLVLAIPVLIAGLPLLLPAARTRRVTLAVATAVLLLFVALSGFSIGLFYLPSVAALAILTANAFGEHPSRTSASLGS